MSLPEISRCICGKRVESAEEFEKLRRDEILGLFEKYVYGRRPYERPEDLSFSVTESIFCGMKHKRVTAEFGEKSFPFDIYIPFSTDKPVPVFVLSILEYREQFCDFNVNPNPEYAPLTDITSRGYAIAVYNVREVEPDNIDGINYGIRSGEHLSDDSWGTLSVWAWAASRILDYIETDDELDESRVCTIGHSRGGKTALWSAATDRRFAMAVSNDSGCAGAAVTREKRGERIKDITDTFPYWFCRNYFKFAENEELLPVDQHMLLALIAPRPLYVASASEDEWADPASELSACRLASEAYALYDKPGIVPVDLDKVELNKSYADGTIAYHRHKGGHDLTKLDWRLFMDFADRMLNVHCSEI